MNQPYPPAPGYGPPGQYPPGGPAPYGAAQQQPGYPQNGYGPPPKKSNLPIWIAAGLVLALGIGVGLFFLLRGDDSGGSGPGPQAAPTPKEVTKSFFTAVDARDEEGMLDNARGDVEGDIDLIMSGEADALGLKFADGQSTDDAAKKVDDVELAVVVWKLNDVPDDLDTDEAELGVALLDDGDGFEVCAIDDVNGSSAKEILEEFEGEFETACDYTPK